MISCLGCPSSHLYVQTPWWALGIQRWVNSRITFKEHSVKNGSPHKIPRAIVGLVICSQRSVQFSRSVVSDSWRPHGPQHARPPCPSSSPTLYSDSRPSSGWFPKCYASAVVVVVFLHLCIYLECTQYFLTTYRLLPNHSRSPPSLQICIQLPTRSEPHQVTVATVSCRFAWKQQ